MKTDIKIALTTQCMMHFHKYDNYTVYTKTPNLTSYPVHRNDVVTHHE